MPDPKEIERELSEFLSKKFGGEVKVISPITFPQELNQDMPPKPLEKRKKINFDLKPLDLIDYLDQYIVRQDQAKAILATKICTHFQRIKRMESGGEDREGPVGRIKNNVLMVGPTGVGKTYMIKLIAQKIGVPFVKGDATKFSETGYVGGDVEDLVRDLVREADDDIETAQYGIIYIDEIDKIASSHNVIGADVSRTGVQRALLKPMEDTEVDLKVPHDPISVFQEIERFRKTGKRSKNTISTRNILFIMSGAFSELNEIIKKRINTQEMGFGARVKNKTDQDEILKQVQSEDLIQFGFESEFVGRLPVRAILERLSEEDLFEILKNPNNPVILGKKLDFDAYGIQMKFDQKSLSLLAYQAYQENTGARGLVSAVEKTLLPFEKSLPSTNVRIFSVTETVVQNPDAALEHLLASPEDPEYVNEFNRLVSEEKSFIRSYVTKNGRHLTQKHRLTLTPSRAAIISDLYSQYALDMEKVIKKIKGYCDDIKKIELYFYKTHDTNIVIEEDAIDYLISRLMNGEIHMDLLYRQLSNDFEFGLKLVRDRTGQSRFFINKEALTNPESYISTLLKMNEDFMPPDDVKELDIV